MDIKVHEVCRACMNNKNDCQNTMGFSKMSEKIIEMFTICTSIKVTEDDGLPLNICETCSDSVQSCYSFINICKSTDEALRYHLTQNIIITDPILKKEDIVSLEHGTLTAIKIEQCDDYENIDIYPEFDLHADCSSEDNKKLIKSHKKKKSKKLKEDAKIVVTNKKSKKKKIKTLIKDKNIINSVSAKRALKSSYDCPVCKTVIVGRNSFNKHLREMHEDFKRFLCKYCKKGFDRSSYLHQHEVTHTRDRPWKCDQCPKTYKQRGQLATHKHIHTELRPYSCEKCPLTFTTKCSLSAHSKLHHGEEENLCHLCGVSFAQVGNLRVHMRTHTGEKPYSCSTCPFKCSVQSGMKRHERMHANLKSHKCPICQKGFNNNGSMVRHIRIHTGELPYKCDYCPKAFIDNWKRKNHLVKAHNIALDTIPKMIPGRKRQYGNKKGDPAKNTDKEKSNKTSNKEALSKQSSDNLPELIPIHLGSKY